MRNVPIRRVVITGMGALSPNGVGIDAYRESLREGRSGVTAVQEFDTTGIGSRIAGSIRGVDLTQAMELKNLRVVSRTVPLAVLAAREAMADAGFLSAELDLETRRQIGVILGTGGGGIAFVEKLYGYYYKGQLEKATALAVPAGTPGNISSELSIQLGIRGPSHVVSTGCTSSTDAIGYAFRRIQHGETPLMLTGGSDAPIAPAIMLGFDVMGIVSRNWNEEPERASRPFSKDRDGFVLGEGSWMLMLEEREHALQRGARIYGELLGYASTCDAWHRVSLSSDLDEPVRAIELALQDAELTPVDIEYANLHGTGTPLNDRVETAAIKRGLGDRASQVPMSSTKSMIGHPQGACGAAGLVATVLGLDAGFLPPTINYEEPDPECDLDYIPNESRAAKGARVALCNCMGFGSKNSVLIVRQGDES